MDKNTVTVSRYISIVLVCFLAIISLPTYPLSAETEKSLQSEILNSELYKPLIVYYSRTGNARIVADALTEYHQLKIEMGC